MRHAGFAVAALLAAACGPPDDAERSGDRAYAAGDYAAAYTAYAAASDAGATPELLAKRGTAALREGDVPGAIEAFRELASADPSRSLEAAEGLAAAARLAAGRGNAEVLHRAVQALRAVEPERPLGRWVLAIAQTGGLADDELIALAPLAIAAAPDQAAGDSLLVAWAGALVRRDDCRAAGPLFRAAARRSRDAALSADAQSGAAACALVVARRALAAADTAAALDALGSVQGWAGTDSSAAAAAALGDEVRAAAERLPPMDTTFFMMEDR